MRIGLSAIVLGCTVRTPALHPPDQVPTPEGASSGLKVHLRSGGVLLLHAWAESDTGMVGTGTLYGPDRVSLSTGQFAIPRDSIALLETATRSLSRAGPGITLMGVWTVLWTALTIQCVSDPKSCFGSCPTFYVEGGDVDLPQAEGFSASIARVLEARDVDALFRSAVSGGRVTIRMTNEAMETHAVRSVRLLAAPRPAGGRVFQGIDGRFYPSSTLLAPVRCAAPEGDCLARVLALDVAERHSLADSTDLAARDTVELEFPPVVGPAGLVVAARQSLVSTYLFYRTIAFLGSGAGEWLAALERTEPAEAQRAMGMARALGPIAVDVLDEGASWRALGGFDEAGPIATDVMVVPLGARPSGPVRVRLRAARGAWRVNWVALARLQDPVIPVPLDAQVVERGDRADPQAFRHLRDPDRYLVTYPGDAYRMTFTLPEGPTQPELAESRMEGLFWTSRFNR